MGGKIKENTDFPRKCLHSNSQFCNHVHIQFYFTQKNNLVDLTGPTSRSNFSDVTSVTEPYFPTQELLFDCRIDFVANF